jgi:hypothetical protein
MLPSATASQCLYRFLAAILLWMATAYGTAALAQQTRPERWDRATASTLVAYIERIGNHGLDPSDYQAAALKEAIQAGDPAALEGRRRRVSAWWPKISRSVTCGRVSAAAITLHRTRSTRSSSHE